MHTSSYAQHAHTRARKLEAEREFLRIDGVAYTDFVDDWSVPELKTQTSVFDRVVWKNLKNKSFNTWQQLLESESKLFCIIDWKKCSWSIILSF